MKTIMYILILLILIGALVFTTYFFGKKVGKSYVSYHALRENYLKLKYYPESKKNTEIYNWLKGRYYYLSRDVSNSDFKHSMKDFGAVDTNILQYLCYAPECNPEKDYNDFKKRYDKLVNRTEK